MNRRAQGISVNVIIIAAIALVVMVILIALIINTGGDINRSTHCENWGGGQPGIDYQCVSQGQACPEGMNPAPPGRVCSQSTQANPQDCCVSLFG